MKSLIMRTSPDAEGAHDFELLGDEPRVSGKGNTFGRSQGNHPLRGDGLRLGILANTLRAVSTAKPRIAHPSHGRLDAARRSGGAVIDIDRSASHLSRDGFGAAKIAAPYARAEPIGRSVRTADGFFVR